MNEDFWERIDRLEELAGKIKVKSWECADDFGKPALIANNGSYGVQIAEAAFAGSVDDLRYIAAANPAVILEMIGELRRLEKEAQELRANNYGPEILNHPQALTISWFAGAMAEGRKMDAEIERLLEENRRLEKEGDWLADKLARFCDPDHDAQCCALCRKNCDGVAASNWRKAAREAAQAPRP